MRAGNAYRPGKTRLAPPAKSPPRRMALHSPSLAVGVCGATAPTVSPRSGFPPSPAYEVPLLSLTFRANRQMGLPRVLTQCNIKGGELPTVEFCLRCSRPWVFLLRRRRPSHPLGTSPARSPAKATASSRRFCCTRPNSQRATRHTVEPASHSGAKIAANRPRNNRFSPLHKAGGNPPWYTNPNQRPKKACQN